MILIGSNAIKYHYPDFKRNPKDIDFAVSSSSKLRSDLSIGYEFIANDILLEYMGRNHPYSHIIPADVLLTLKASHLAWDLDWAKHMFDVQFLIKKGNKIILGLFHEFYGYYNMVHSRNKRSDLKMSAKDFFDNALKCDYYHDDLHTILRPTPTYTKVLKDNAEVEVSEEKFNMLGIEEKVALVVEEVMVMAYERYYKEDYRVAYAWMLKKFIISHAPLWEYIFIIENYHLLNKPKFDYIEYIDDNIHKLKKKYYQIYN